jgi:putative intracellular protease/amidase
LDVTQFGGTYVDKPCVVDGNLISARGWQDYKSDFMKQFLRRLQAGKRGAR